MEVPPPAGETVDPSGARVVLDGRVWSEKIVRDHPEIASHKDDALRAVAAPDHFAADPDSAKALLSARRWSESMAARVVSFEQPPARSVFANRRDPKTWSA
jgi:hypothetical protein